MHILFCLDYYYPHVGGGEILFQNLAESLAQRGEQVTVVTQLVRNAVREEVHNGVHIHRVQTFGSRYLFPIVALPTMARLARSADLIHTSTFAAALPAWFAARLCRKKIILTVHEVWIGKWSQVSDAGWLSNHLNDIAERLIYLPSYDQYIAVSNATRRDLVACGVAEQKISVIYNGVDYEHWNPEKYNGANLREKMGLQERYLFVFSGRAGRSKGLPVLLKAFAQLNDKRAVLLVIASQAKACRRGYEEAVRLADELGISEQVVFMDSRPYDEFPNYIAMADCVCVPSLSEGFGFCAAEACAMGKPLIATDNASLPEVVGGRYLLVPPGDAAVFASAMKDAISGKFSISTAPHFSIEANVQAHLALYGSFWLKKTPPKGT